MITAAAQGRRAVQRFVQQAEGRTQASRKPHHVQWVAKLPVVGVLPVVGGRARTFQPAAQGSKVASGARQPAAQGSQRRKADDPPILKTSNKAASGGCAAGSPSHNRNERLDHKKEHWHVSMRGAHAMLVCAYV